MKHARATKQKYTAEKVKSSLRERGVHIRTLTRGGMVEESRNDDLLHRLMFLMRKAMQQSQKVEDYQDMLATCAAQNSRIRNIYNSIARTRSHSTLQYLELSLLFVSGTSNTQSSLDWVYVT